MHEGHADPSRQRALRPSVACSCDQLLPVTLSFPEHSPLVPFMESVQSPGFALLVFRVSCRVFAAPSGDGSTLSTLTLLSRGNDAEIESPIASLSDAFLMTGAGATPTVSSATFTEQARGPLCCLAGAWAAAALANNIPTPNTIAAASRRVVG